MQAFQIYGLSYAGVVDGLAGEFASAHSAYTRIIAYTIYYIIIAYSK